MVRRAPADVAAGGCLLPPVTRARVVITPPASAVDTCRRLGVDAGDLRRRLDAARGRGGSHAGGGGGDVRGVAALEAKLDAPHRLLAVVTMRAKRRPVCSRLVTLLGRSPPPKVAVFASHTEMLAALSATLTAAGVRHVLLDGATRPASRAAAVDAFQTEPAVRVALLGLRVAGAGLTLTAADVVLFAVKPPPRDGGGFVDDDEPGGGNGLLRLGIGKDTRKYALLAHISDRHAQKGRHGLATNELGGRACPSKNHNSIIPQLLARHAHDE